MKMSKRRKEKGYTQTELGKKLGVSQQQVAKYESGKSTPSRRVLGRIAFVLDLNPYETWGMFFDDQPPQAAEKEA